MQLQSVETEKAFPMAEKLSEKEAEVGELRERCKVSAERAEKMSEEIVSLKNMQRIEREEQQLTIASCSKQIEELQRALKSSEDATLVRSVESEITLSAANTTIMDLKSQNNSLKGEIDGLRFAMGRSDAALFGSSK